MTCLTDVQTASERSEEIRRQLLERNPFASSAAPNPWDNTSPDLDSLNRDVFDRIAQMVRDKRRAPASPMAGLVLGEAGSGKTHMLKRLLGTIRRKDQAAVFVTVRAFLDSESVMRHLLREVFVNLNQKRRDGRTQLHFLADRLLERYRELCAEERRDPQEGKARYKALKRAMLGIDEGFLRSVLLYAETGDEDLRDDIASWLMGESDETHPELLGVRDRDAMSPEALESEARELLLSLGRLLRYCDVSMIVCFDQLDCMEKKELVNAWGSVIHTLVNDMYGVLPLAFLRADTWNLRFAPILDDSVRQRFGTNFPSMENCNLEQARKLIRNRVDAFFGDTAEATYLWLMERLQGVLRTDLSPRTVIDLANRAISQDDPHGGRSAVPEKGASPVAGEKEEEEKEVLDILGRAYHEEKERATAERDLWPPNRDQLILALETWLETRPEFLVMRTPDKYVGLTGQRSAAGGMEACAFIVLTAKHHKTVGAALDRALQFLESNAGGLCWLVADLEEMSSLERWPAARRKLSDFKARKGRAILLDEGRRAAWYALVALRNKLYNGDVSLYLRSGFRTAEKADFTRFVREVFSEELLRDEPDDKEGDLSDKPMSSEDEARLGEAILNALNGSPMKIMKADLLLEILNRNGFVMGYARLLAFLNREKGCFILYPAGDGSLVQAA